jgi:hypothetical protein
LQEAVASHFSFDTPQFTVILPSNTAFIDLAAEEKASVGEGQDMDALPKQQ